MFLQSVDDGVASVHAGRLSETFGLSGAHAATCVSFADRTAFETISYCACTVETSTMALGSERSINLAQVCHLALQPPMESRT